MNNSINQIKFIKNWPVLMLINNAQLWQLL